MPVARLVKQPRRYGAMPEADLDGDGDGDKLRATIYVAHEHRLPTGDLDAVIRYTPGIPDGRDFSHEAAHILRDQDNDELHHPWWHFCGLVGHTLRTRRHLTAREIEAGAKLHAARDGQVVTVSFP